MLKDKYDELIDFVDKLDDGEKIDLKDVSNYSDLLPNGIQSIYTFLREKYGNGLKIKKTSDSLIIEKDNLAESLSIKGKPNIYNNATIKVDREYYSIYELKRKYDRSKKGLPATIILDSDFQRNKVWSINQQSELIESVLMGLPLPLIYLFEDKRGNLLVVDGRQRLTTFLNFLIINFP